MIKRVMLWAALVSKTSAMAAEPLSLVPIAVARWTREVLRAETGVAVSLKWPNDLYVGRQKLAGVIAESRTQGENTYVAVGIGINVLGGAGALGVANATTVEAETGKAVALTPHRRTVIRRGRILVRDGVPAEDLPKIA